jgi:outer membrane protein assembly factor BamB
VFVESDSGKLYALDAVTGTQLWSTSLGSAFDPSLSVSLMTAGNGLLLVPLGKSLVAYTLSNNP